MGRTEGELRQEVARAEPLARAESLENQGQVGMAVAQNEGATVAAQRGEEARLQEKAAAGQIAAARDRSAAENKGDWAAREGRNGAGYGEKAAEDAGRKYDEGAVSDRERARSAGDGVIENKAGERAEVDAYKAGMEKVIYINFINIYIFEIHSHQLPQRVCAALLHFRYIIYIHISFILIFRCVCLCLCV